MGVQVTNNLKWEEQANLAASKAKRIFGVLKKAFKCWDPNMTRKLYSAYIRPHLEYANSVWNSYTNVDVSVMEKVQRKVTKMAVGLKNKDYSERLKALNLSTLSERRERGDAIQLFRIVNGQNKVNWCKPMIQVPSFEQSV